MARLSTCTTVLDSLPPGLGGTLSSGSSDASRPPLYSPPLSVTHSRSRRSLTTRRLVRSKPAQSPFPTVGTFVDPVHGLFSRPLSANLVCQSKRQSPLSLEKTIKSPTPGTIMELIPYSLLPPRDPPSTPLPLSPSPSPREPPIHLTRRPPSQPTLTTFTHTHCNGHLRRIHLPFERTRGTPNPLKRTHRCPIERPL